MPVHPSLAKPFGLFLPVPHLGKLHSPVHHYEHAVFLERIDYRCFTAVLVFCPQDVRLPLEYCLLGLVSIVECIFELVLAVKLNLTSLPNLLQDRVKRVGQQVTLVALLCVWA